MTGRDNRVDNNTQLTTDEVRRVKKYGDILSKSAGWMKLIAIVSVISSIVTVVGTWWTIFFMWVPVWSSVVLFRASRETHQAARSGIALQLESALGRLGLYFKISGVVTLVSLILMVLSLFISLPILFAGMA